MGLITDGTGSAVPDAALTVSSASTSLQRTTKSNAYGRYFVPYLTPGKYELGVSKNAFKKAVVSAITLEVHQTARVDVSLEVGDIETTITVEAPAAATLQSDNTTVGGDIEQRALEELPGRDVFTSLSLSTNVANLRMHGFNGNVLSGLQPGSNRFLSANMNFGGQRQTANYYWLDGLSNTNWNINSMTNTPSVESLQEARVQVSTSSQQFGQAPGGIINVVTRAGTNDFHGEVYNYLRNDALDARPYNFSSEVQPKAPLHHNQFGASFGGQLISDKVFFFAHYEGLEARSRQEGSASPPTRRAREGDLTDYGRTIYDPLSTSGGFRTPFPNNTIPRNRFSPVANKYLEFTPLPNVPGEIQRNFLGQRPSRTHNNQGNLRIDTQLAPTDWLSGAFHVNDQKQNVEDVYNGITGTSTRTRAWNATLNETHVFSPSLINNFKIGYNRLVAVDGVYSEFRRDIIGELGIEGINRDPANWGFPSVFVSSIGFPVDSAQRPINQRDNLYHVLNDVTLLKGRHTLQFGGEFRKIELNYRQASPARGHFLFTNVFSSGPDPIDPLAETGLELADFLLGFPQQAVRTVGATQGYLRTSYAAGYVNDSIRINPRLTLMLGLRYGYQSPPREIRNNYFNLDFSTLPNPPELVRVGVDPSGLPERGVRANRKNWSPLVGLAYRADSKTVVRAGYGIYYQHEMGAIYYNLVRNGVRSETNDSTVTSPQLDFDDAFRNPRFGLPSHHYIDPNAVTPYVQQWNFTIQRELPLLTNMELAYIGNKGNHLYRFRSYNTAFHTETGENLDPRQGQLQELRTFPSIGPISAIESSASSIYHSLHFRTSRRFCNGVSFINSFTWAKSIDDASDPLQSFYQNLGAQDERNLGLERGLSFHDIRKRFTSSVIWELPFGTGQRWLNKGLLGYIAGPWQLTSNLIAQDGYAQTLIGFSTSSTTGTFQRPNIVPGEPLVLPKSQRRNPLRWYNPAAVQWPGPFELGNAGRNIAPTPGAVTANVGVFRRIRLPGEGQEILVRADALNALNFVNLGIPSSYDEPFFGGYYAAADMRTITLSVKVRF